VQALATILMSGVLGGIADRLPRRALVVVLELIRAAILVATPTFLLPLDWRFIFPVLFFLASINAIVQPARQAAIPGLVPAGQIGKANAIVLATTMFAGAVGFALAGAILSRFSTTVLFITDAVTFALAAGIIVGIPSLGGGATGAPLSGALRRTWAIVAARPHLIMATLAGFLLTMSFPALLALAYRLNPANGGLTYSLLEVVLSVGVFAGSIAVGRLRAIGTMRTVGAGLLLTGIFSLAIAMSPSLLLVAIALLVASIGNPIYAVANQTALMEASDPSNRGSVMSIRFGLVQTATIVGAAAGGLISSSFGDRGPLVVYGVLGVGLSLLALYALAAGRSTINALHGAAYEEAQIAAATAHGRVQ
jgi:predicted MFS family arabinose efflux permease